MKEGAGISKELFLETINAIKMQDEHDQKCQKAFQTILRSNFISGYDNHWIQNQLIRLLKNVMKDKETEWIEYFIYELDFGKKWRKGCVTFNGEDVVLKTASDLWDLLNR